MAAKQITNARFANRIDTRNSWKNYSPTLLKGELGLVTNDSGKLLYGIVGDGQTDINTIIENPDSYDDNYFYAGKGAQYEFNVVAGTTTLGGIKLLPKVNNDTPQPLTMVAKTGETKKEYLSLAPELISGWDDIRKCFEVPKLFIKELYTVKTKEDALFKAEKLILRDDSEQNVQDMAEGDYSGIMVNQIADGGDGFLGIDYRGFPHIFYDNTYYPLPIYDKSATNRNVKGFVSINPSNSMITLYEPSALKISRGSTTVTYNGLNTNDIEISYPTINLNNQNLAYNETTNTYTGIFDGGLTQENANKLAEIDTIKTDMLTADDIVAGSDIVINKEESIAISHSAYPSSGDSNIIEGGTVTEIPAGPVTFIVGLEIENGHIRKIKTANYTFK